ncbi:MAG: MBOAT family protein [Clostridiales bacterium]|nr:MBOAT family protein [Candidatus Crickella merdequi]
MLFSSLIFLVYFLPITVIVYYSIPTKRLDLRNIWLLLASLVFYSWGEPVYVFLMIYSALFNYFMAGQIAREKEMGGSGKRNMLFTLVMNLLILGFFKYWGFLMETINAVLGLHLQYTALPLPIGISFYTFQGLSYIFDVYRGKVEVQKNPLKVALYLALFPQLIAGPIVNYKDIEKQLDERTCNMDRFGEGAVRFCIGLGKKVILANNLGALFAEICLLPDSRMSLVTAWIGILGYTFQIYFDFSGYSDMAIGLGKMFGFDFKENFNYPYISKSISDFWRRWHISLSSWFRDYVYIPLGGNRCSVPRHILNLLIVWSLTGLWHGANWNFVAWGTYFGILLILEKYLIGKYIEKLPEWAKHVYTMLIVIISWVFFSITDTAQMFHYLAMMFGLGGVSLANMTTVYYLRTSIVLLIAATAGSTPKPAEFIRKLCDSHEKLGITFIMAVFVMALAYLVFGSYNPFLYFRF